MPRTGRPKEALVLSDEERVQLVRWSRRAKSAQSLALRSRIVLACADGTANKAVAATLGCSPATVGKLSLIHISEPTRRTPISYAVFCLKKKKHKRRHQ